MMVLVAVARARFSRHELGVRIGIAVIAQRIFEVGGRASSFGGCFRCIPFPESRCARRAFRRARGSDGSLLKGHGELSGKRRLADRSRGRFGVGAATYRRRLVSMTLLVVRIRPSHTTRRISKQVARLQYQRAWQTRRLVGQERKKKKIVSEKLSCFSSFCFAGVTDEDKPDEAASTTKRSAPDDNRGTKKSKGGRKAKSLFNNRRTASTAAATQATAAAATQATAAAATAAASSTVDPLVVARWRSHNTCSSRRRAATRRVVLTKAIAYAPPRRGRRTLSHPTLVGTGACSVPRC